MMKPLFLAVAFLSSTLVFAADCPDMAGQYQDAVDNVTLIISQNKIPGKGLDCSNISIDDGSGLVKYLTDGSAGPNGDKVSWEGQSLAIVNTATVRNLLSLTQSGGLQMQQQVLQQNTWISVGQPALFVGSP
jgi:hypothetical protein